MSISNFVRMGVVCAVSAGAASATPLYSQRTDLSASSFFGYGSTSNATFFVGVHQIMADNFTLTAFGETKAIERVRWAGSGVAATFPTDVTQLVSSFTISFYADTGGAGGVGGLFYTETFGIGQTNASLVNSDFSIYEHTVTLSNAFMASHDTTYWISIVATMVSDQNDTNWLWLTGAEGGDGRNGALVNGGPLWQYPTGAGVDLDFELLGAQSVIIPLPSVAGLSALGLLAVAGGRRRVVR